MIDAYRIAPRAILIVYGFLVWEIYIWFKSLETIAKIQCQEDIFFKLIQNGIDVNKASEIACVVIEVVGGPTAQQTTFVTAIVGLSTAIIGLYLNSGRRWEKKG